MWATQRDLASLDSLSRIEKATAAIAASATIKDTACEESGSVCVLG